MLTRKQQILLGIIHERLEAEGVPPSFEEMKEALGLHSKSGVHRLVTALEERGFLRRLPHRARAMEILRLPESMGKTPGLVPASGGVLAGVTARPRRGGASRPMAAAGSSRTLPFYGRIAAGVPIETTGDAPATFDVPPAMVGRGEHYVLEVVGDSMIEAGIFDGDLALMRQTEQVEEGSIAAVLVDEEAVTLKHVRHRAGKIILEAANARYAPRELPADRVHIQGQLAGLIRRY